ncbi:prolyl oligopeptidase family serine peptidase [uncultured Eudoraea sp.]|uniref:alpha/beta hydrolase family protein n=1 Tax=uncultured Eudoraea sp. TaxID=1035614 RepID=UPI002613BB6A|nr:prolyl oligopeptidase family serine peptidase [uncultured Eudoraea sp.]
MRKSFYLLLILSIISCSPNTNKETSDRSGVYNGLFEKGNFSDSIIIEIEQDSLQWRAYFTSLEQNANRIPFREVEVKGDSINFKIQSDFYTYSFKNLWAKTNSKLSGSLTVDTLQIPYTLYKVAGKMNIPASEDINFRTNDLKLNGTIYYPANDRKEALVIVTSSGNSDRSASRAEAQLFAKRGYTTFIYDKRGTGSSEGNWSRASIEELASDDINAITWFSKKTNIPLDQIGIKGNSQGASKIPFILNEIKDLKYGIAVSCPGSTLLESDLNYWKNRNQENLGEHFEEATKFERKVFETIAGVISKETLQKEIDQNKSKEWFNKVWIPDLAEIEIDQKLNYSPIPYFEKTKQPILVVQGSLDEIIPPKSYEAINEALEKAQNKNHKIVVLEGASHSMYEVTKSDFPYWSKLHRNYLSILENWIQSLNQ